MEIKRFIDSYKDENVATRFQSGRIWYSDERYLINGAMIGAEETFSVGQPVFNKNGDLLGYLNLHLLTNLNYSTDGFDGRIPCEVWEIDLPTIHCKRGIEVYTYWQNQERKKNESNLKVVYEEIEKLFDEISRGNK